MTDTKLTPRQEFFALVKLRLADAGMQLLSGIDGEGNCTLAGGKEETRVNVKCQIKEATDIPGAVEKVKAAMDSAAATHAKAMEQYGGEFVYVRPNKGYRVGDVVASDTPIGIIRTMLDSGFIRRADAEAKAITAPPADKMIHTGKVRQKAAV